MLLITGDQVPLIPLVEVVGSGLKVLPIQMGATCVKIGVLFGLTCMVMVVGKAHCPGAGVNV